MKYAIGACALLFSASAASAAEEPQVPDISGMWNIGAPAQSAFLSPTDGRAGPVVHLNPPPVTAGGGAAVYWEGDDTNPMLQPWTAEIVRRNAELNRQDNPPLSAQQACRPHGVPYILQLNDTVQFLQTPDEIVFLYSREMRWRIVHMNTGHPADLKPDYYGHSVGHWQGNTLVIDTIGLNDKTYTDRFGTPHTDKIHVVQRFEVVDADTIHVDFTVEDPGAFTMPWSGIKGYRRGGNYLEQVCAENNRNPVTDEEYPIPRDDTPDF
jgi:hypothetical protein